MTGAAPGGRVPRLLDLYSGAGGAAMGYDRAGFDVTGVDIAPQPRYPFRFIRADALEYVIAHGGEYDAIHASPPCQKYLNLTRVNETLGRANGHPDLIALTRAALMAQSPPWIIENVEGAPLRNPVRLCGTAFGLPLRRHRLFESSVMLFGTVCCHDRFTEPRYWTGWRPNGERRLATVVQVYGHGGNVGEWAAAMDIDWMNRRELAEAIPPAYTAYIGAQLLAALTSSTPAGADS